MLELTIPKTQKLGDVIKIYYVSSESKPTDKHIVVRKNGLATVQNRLYFCDCKDFMIRQLPLHVVSGSGPLCKHATFVRDAEFNLPPGMEIIRAVRDKIKTAAI